jgi:hypothetical protein
MRDHGVSSSDIERARELSRRLAFPSRQGSAQAVDTTAYIRFPAVVQERPGRAVEATTTSTSAVPTPAVSERASAASWEDLLAWLAEQLGAEAAFIVDNQGFVIANRGKIPSDGFEALGAEVYMSFEQLERVDTLAGRLIWIELEFTRRRLTALRARVPGREQMLFVAINSSAEHAGQKAAIERIVLDGMARL